MNRSQIFAHRGLWKVGGAPPNTLESLEAAFKEGFAVETDVRDQQDKLVISHDPCGSSAFDSFNFETISKGRIAINIKSDGLVKQFLNLAESIRHSNSFVFDCSFPQILQYKKIGIPHALRISEYEQDLPWTPEFIWLDSFEGEWWIGNTKIRKMMDTIPTVIVSPELHGRNHIRVWEEYLALVNEIENIGICTDLPLELEFNLGLL